MSYSYIASPYSHPDPKVRTLRYNMARQFAGELLLTGHFCYSPIVYCHNIAVEHSARLDFGFWESFNYAMLGAAKNLIVLRLPGWDESIGVKAEIDFAISHNKPIHHVSLREPLDARD